MIRPANPPLDVTPSGELFQHLRKELAEWLIDNEERSVPFKATALEAVERLYATLAIASVSQLEMSDEIVDQLQRRLRTNTQSFLLEKIGGS